MNILNKVTWQTMWKNKTRTIVTIIGIILSTAMFTAVATLGVSLVNYLIDITAYQDGDYFIRYDYGTDSDIAGVYQEEHISQVGDLKALGFTNFVLEQEKSTIDETYVVAAGNSDFFDMVSTRLQEGRLPENSNELVITGNLVSYLRDAGLPHQVGDTITLKVFPEYAPRYQNDSVEIPSDGMAFTKEYQIVGISETFYKLDDFTLDLSYLLTYADDHVEPTLWHRIYVKTTPAKAAWDLQGKPYGPVQNTNTDMLNLYGASKYTNINHFIYVICGVLMAIIMIGSISLIYNAFSISVSERTKQFGLLSSIGATKRQLRRSVHFEAVSLCLMGIPVGIFSGFFGIQITLNLTANLISGLLAGSTESGIDLHAVGSIPAFLCAGTVAAATVFLSVFIPAKRVTKVAPIAAIRQTQDYSLPKKGLKSSKWTVKIWGLPGLLAQKYYTVSKHKYRATVISLAISVILFVTSCSFTQVLQSTADTNANTSNYDLCVFDLPNDQLAQIRNHTAVQDSVLRTSQQFICVVSDDIFTDAYLKACNTYNEATGYEDAPNSKYVTIYYLEDRVLRAYLEEHGIDPQPYFDAQNPTALVMSSEIFIYKRDGNISERRVYASDVFRENADSLFLYPSFIPEALSDFLGKISPSYYWEDGNYQGYPMATYWFTESLDESAFASTPYLQTDGSLNVVTVPQDNDDGTYAYAFYFYDPMHDCIAEEPIAISDGSVISPKVKIGETVSDLPFGISNHTESEVLSLVMPLSMVDTETDPPNLFIRVKDYGSITGYLDQHGIDYADLLESQMQHRNIVTMVNVFSFGFIILISLICVCNVFNTISTNIALRRRDFGMLRSVGMQNRALNRMMIFECLKYGIRALVIGLPLGVLASFGIQSLMESVGNHPFQLPLLPMCIAATCVFLIVFISMLYARSKLKKDNPIEAIRMENL